jgi:hypothetical protein
MRSPRDAGSGNAAASTSRGATSTPRTEIGSVESSPSLRSVFSTSMNSSPRPYLKVTRLQSTQRGTIGGVAGKDVREAGLDADPDEREQVRPGPALVLVELLLAEQRVRARERHRHVEVRTAGLEGGLEDRQVEARVGRVQDDIVIACQRRHARLIGRVHLGRGKAVVAEPVDERCGLAGWRSAKVIRSKKSRRCATAATAAPTPPVPTTRIFTE